jgi:hypothetical protein
MVASRPPRYPTPFHFFFTARRDPGAAELGCA